MSPADIWFAGHRPTGAEMARQLGAMRKGGHIEDNITLHTIDDFASLPERGPSALVVVPPITTWARGRHHRPLGPKPLRSTDWLWGFPWLSPSDRQMVDEANAELRELLKLIVDVLHRAPGTFVMLLHPEQLVPLPRGSPGSIWDLPKLRGWARQAGMMRFATFQCRFQKTDYKYPIGVLSSHSLNSKLFDLGWPSIAARAPHYQGPLPRHCTCGNKAHRPRAVAGHRLEHRGDHSILQDEFTRFLLGTIVRNMTGQSIAELLRSGEAPQRGVRDAHQEGWDSSEGQETWIPSDLASSSMSDADGSLHNRIHWDRELSDILGLYVGAPRGLPEGHLQPPHIHSQPSVDFGQDPTEPGTVPSKKS